MAPASGRAITGPNAETARNTVATPTPLSWPRSPPEPNSPSTTAATPTTASTVPRTRRNRVDEPSSDPASSRRAASGDARPARTAGSAAAAMVTTTPRTTDTITVRGSSWGDVEGRSTPTAPSRACRPTASRIPSPSPRTDDTSPMMADSASTMASNWRRNAPRHRSRASSRLRWATMMENVLKMMKAPTNSATPAKISSAVFRNPKPLDRLVELWAWNWAPVCTWNVGPRTPAMRLASAASLTEWSEPTSTYWSRPTLPVTAWAVARSNPTMVAPARLSADP